MTKATEADFVPPSPVQMAAFRAQLTMAEVVSARYDKLTGWLVAGMGAALTFMISNVDKASTILAVPSIRLALKIYIGALVLHVAQRLVGTFIDTAQATHEKASKDDLSALKTVPDLFAFLALIERPAVPPFSWVVSRTLDRSRRGQLMGDWAIYAMQALIILSLLQFGCAIWALVVIVRGLV